MSLALNESSAVWHLECSNAMEIYGRIILDFYTGL